MRSETLKNCWSLKGCPASHYMKCEPYRRKLDCWEIGEGKGCLCHIYETCPKCPIYSKRMNDGAFR